MNHRLPLSVVVLSLVAVPAVAGTTTFFPTVRLDAGYTDNVGIVGVDQTSDTVYRTALDLPVQRAWKSGSFSFRYQPSYIKHQDADDLDRDEHSAGMSVDNQLGRNAGFNASLDFQQSQVQGNLLNTINTDPTLTARTQRNIYRADVGFQGTPGQRWNWNASVGAESRRHDTIAGINALPGFNVEDRDSYRAGVGLDHQAGRNTRYGFSYGFQNTDLDINGEEDNHDFRLTLDQQLGRTRSLSVQLGAFTARNTDAAGNVSDRDGASGRISFNAQTRNVAMAVYAEARPTSGGSLQGTSDNTSLGLSFSGRSLVRWSWSSSANYTERDPAGIGPKTSVVALDANFGRRLGSRLDFSFGTRYAWQDNGGMLDNREVLSVSAGLVWFIKGRAPRGAGGAVASTGLVGDRG